MTAIGSRRPAIVPAVPGVVACLGGMGLLLARPWLGRWAIDPTLVLVALFGSLGAMGAWWPLAQHGSARMSGARGAALVAGVGIGAFGLGRAVAGGRGAVAFSLTWVGLNTLAAVAEEAFFRRLVYGLLIPHGVAVAVVGSAALFAVVHVTVWGAWVLPIDFAAGLVLSWQRWATGRWSVPALTHGCANVLALA